MPTVTGFQPIITMENPTSLPRRLTPLTFFRRAATLFRRGSFLLGIRPSVAIEFSRRTSDTPAGGAGAVSPIRSCNQGFARGRGWRWAAIGIALVTPILFTPRWNGTDIFLWAAVPWILQWLVPPSNGALINIRKRFDFLAGALSGISGVLFRYQALFLVGYAGVLIALQSRLRPKELIHRATALGSGLLPFLGIQICLNYFSSNAPVTFPPSGRFHSHRSIRDTVRPFARRIPEISTPQISLS